MAAPTSRWASLLMVLLLFYEVNREDPRYDGDRGFARTVAATIIRDSNRRYLSFSRRDHGEPRDGLFDPRLLRVEIRD